MPPPRHSPAGSPRSSAPGRGPIRSPARPGRRNRKFWQCPGCSIPLLRQRLVGGGRSSESPCFLSANPALAHARNRPDALTSRRPNLVYNSQADVKPLRPQPASHAPGVGRKITKGRNADMKPTHTRYWVVVFALALAMIMYIQRVAISQAIVPISADLHLNKAQTGIVLGAFGLSYALFEIPMGLLGDKLGVRRVLSQLVLLWSLFTALTGAAWSLISLWAIRF